MIYSFTTAITGLGLFLLGMKYLTIGLKYLVSSQIKNKIKGLTIHPILGLFIGAVTTMLLQSSSSTTIIMVGLVEAGLLSIYQVTPMIMGANIGTTITAQIIAFNIGPLAAIILLLGVILTLLKANKKVQLLGEVLLGVGLIFIGINLLGEGLVPLKDFLAFKNVLAELGNRPILGVLMGFSTTAIIQSSSTGVAILQSLVMNNTIAVASAIPILLGQNIGTCVTTLIASLHLGGAGKKVAVIHLLFNTLGVIVILPFLHQLYNLAVFMAPTNYARQLAHTHTLFNVITTLLLLPLFPLMVKGVEKIIRDN
ncbi:Na/Pi cotransporter family protein [Alkaliphilus serpentinus]|uniref:Na/Pi cotransporter family protein n=1 Tax=Alkaliphilus serpentinus TaxID=1482731 RepID=A0A833HNN1_9FIRM|nr:Na/Pi symporter [Alkaliphilus serpentinus]KAB3529838.1 Na/Pi cotransporter family protein [Alkaliphilus serpentinus]